MQTDKKEVGAVSGIIIIILVLLAGGFYIFNQRIEKQKQIEAQIQNTENTQEANTLSSEANAMDFEDLDSGVDQVK